MECLWHVCAWRDWFFFPFVCLFLVLQKPLQDGVRSRVILKRVPLAVLFCATCAYIVLRRAADVLFSKVSLNSNGSFKGVRLIYHQRATWIITLPYTMEQIRCCGSVLTRMKNINVQWSVLIVGLGKKFYVAIFSDIINVMNVILCVMALLIELYLSIPLPLTLTILKDTTMSNSLNFKFYVLIRISSNFIRL